MYILLLIMIVSLTAVTIRVDAAIISPRRQCPNKEFCECNFETRKIECLCKQPSQQQASQQPQAASSDCADRLTFANKSISEFREVYVNNVPRFDRTFFAHAQLSPQFRLSLQSTRELASRFLADLVGLTLLEIIYFERVHIEARAFDGLKCETFSFISLGENTPIDLNAFGSDTRINSLLLDFHSTNDMATVFENTDPLWLDIQSEPPSSRRVTREQLVAFWSSRARIKKIYIQEVHLIYFILFYFN